jgi:integrase
MPNSTARKPRHNRPRKPREFPLSIHKGTGYWCKKVRGHVHYFGKVADDPKGETALNLWLEQKDYLLAGKLPPETRAQKGEEVTVADVCNEFLNHQEERRDRGEIVPRTFWQLHATCAILCKSLGRARIVADLRPDDFGRLKSSLAKKRGPVALSNEMQRCRSVFLFAYRLGLIPSEVRYGTKFDKPPKRQARRERRLHREQYGDRMFEAVESRQLLDGKSVKGDDGKLKHIAGASPALRAMILLAINGGFGQADLSAMPLSIVDLDKAIVTYPRPKTEADRIVPLWPETCEAIRKWIPQRPKAKNRADSGLLFLTCFGRPFVKVGAKGAGIDGIGQEFNKLLKRLGLERPGRSFYGLRRSFRTFADEVPDKTAIDLIMGHVPTGIAAQHYIEKVSPERLRAVAEHVRSKVFAKDNRPLKKLNLLKETGSPAGSGAKASRKGQGGTAARRQKPAKKRHSVPVSDSRPPLRIVG